MILVIIALSVGMAACGIFAAYYCWLYSIQSKETAKWQSLYREAHEDLGISNRTIRRSWQKARELVLSLENRSNEKSESFVPVRHAHTENLEPISFARL